LAKVDRPVEIRQPGAQPRIERPLDAWKATGDIARAVSTDLRSSACVEDDGSTGWNGGAQGMSKRELEYAWMFRAEFPAVVRTVFLIVHDRGTAEDIAQEAFIQLLRHWRKVSAYERPEAWVRRVAIRLAARHLRRRRPTSPIGAGDDIGVEARSTDLDLLDAVGRLPVMQRAAVVLFYFEDRPVAEIEEILGVSAGTVKQHLHRARTRLGELLGEEVDAPDVG
jgi:RNA polymerase sigma-70 factor (ECF subfamily)